MNREFKGIWIPREIWLSKKLTINEKFFLAEIDSLDNEEGCFANNAYFANFFQLSKSRVSQIINSLGKKGFIDITFIYKENSQEIEKRIIRINKAEYFNLLNNSEDTPLSEIEDPLLKTKAPLSEIKGPPFENAKDNNTTINIEEEEEINSKNDENRNTDEAEKANTNLNDFSEEIKLLENYTGMELKGLVHKNIYIKWREEWGVSFELIIKAAELMCKLAKMPNLDYLEQILIDWRRLNVSTPEGVDKILHERKKTKGSYKNNKSNEKRPNTSAFSDYEIYVPPQW